MEPFLIRIIMSVIIASKIAKHVLLKIIALNAFLKLICIVENVLFLVLQLTILTMIHNHAYPAILIVVKYTHFTFKYSSAMAREMISV